MCVYIHTSIFVYINKYILWNAIIAISNPETKTFCGDVRFLGDNIFSERQMRFFLPHFLTAV